MSSAGRVGILKWLIAQVSNPDYIVTSCYVLVDVVLLFASWVFFMLLYFINTEAKTSINDLLKFSLDLPAYSKYVLYVFTVLLAIPNKIFINHNFNNYLVRIFVILLFLLTKISPFFIFPLAFYLILTVESLVIAFLYESKSKTFKTHLDRILFSGNQKFAKQYFEFFWGNMDKAGKAAAKTGLAGWLVRLGWSTITELEDRQAQEEAERRSAKAVQSANTPTSAQEVMEMTESEKKKIMEKNATFSNVEELCKRKFKEAIEKLNKKK